GGAAAYFFFLKKSPPEENVNATENATEEKPKPPPELKELSKPGIFISVGDFVVNLADTDVQRFVKVSVTIEVMNEKVQNEVNQMMPAIKDAINDLISSKYYRDVRTPEGRERLKIELLKRLNALLPEGGIKAVYFTQFVVQTM
ncbi:MAG: flagellar basal body protein FliL, partial [Aquificaceae bacterium]